jgi:hypothetical protein
MVYLSLLFAARSASWPFRRRKTFRRVRAKHDVGIEKLDRKILDFVVYPLP